MPSRRTNPIVPGIIIAASIVVAAGLAIYENEPLRLWLEERRRQIALAFYDFGDNINPDTQSRSGESHSAEASRQRRLEIVRRNRAALIRRAREEGIAVDLDELSALGREQQEMEQRRPSNTSFDSLVRQDGTLRVEPEKSQATGSAARSSTVNSALRQRGPGARGLAAGAAFANPFDDEAQILFDQEMIGPGEGEIPQSQAPSSIRAISPRPASTVPTVIDVPVYETSSTQSQPQSQYKTDEELEAEIEEAIRRSLQDIPSPSTATLVDISTPLPPSPGTLSPAVSADLAGLDDSLYALPSPRAETAFSQSYHPEALTIDAVATESAIPVAEEEAIGSQTPRIAHPMSPRSDMSEFGSALSSALSSALPSTTGPIDEAEVHSLASDDEVFDARSEAGMSEAYSLVGASTPGSWTDVDTDNEGEEMNGSRAARA
jgi:hypothetical protein